MHGVPPIFVTKVIGVKFGRVDGEGVSSMQSISSPFPLFPMLIVYCSACELWRQSPKIVLYWYPPIPPILVPEPKQILQAWIIHSKWISNTSKYVLALNHYSKIDRGKTNPLNVKEFIEYNRERSSWVVEAKKNDRIHKQSLGYTYPNIPISINFYTTATPFLNTA